ncbi:hypothetical protein KAW65_07165 [candidate division WOR-3 bacterium]|nr:hypothetical protein [candidate division WOR-3 bacterium]
MRVLLVRPLNKHVIFYDASKEIIEASGHQSQPALGLLYIAACTEKNTYHKAMVLDAIAEGLKGYKDLERDSKTKS